MRRNIAVGALVAAVAVLAVGCADLSHYNKESTDLTASTNDKVDGLLARAHSLKDRADKLPPSSDSTDLQSRAASNVSNLEKMKGSVGAYPDKMKKAVKGGDEREAQELLNEEKTEGTSSLDAQSSALDNLNTDLTKAEATATQAAAAAADTKPATFKKTLPGGYALQGAPDGIEAQLVGFIEDSGKKPDKTTWFNFDRLTFVTSAADLDMIKSKDQLTNVAEILKAYPAVKLKVGGYTDNQGKAALNKKLSKARAVSVTKELESLGAKKSQLDPDGYGSEHPVCAANDSEDCRAQNRRIAVRVEKK